MPAQVPEAVLHRQGVGSERQLRLGPGEHRRPEPAGNCETGLGHSLEEGVVVLICRLQRGVPDRICDKRMRRPLCVEFRAEVVPVHPYSFLIPSVTPGPGMGRGAGLSFERRWGGATRLLGRCRLAAAFRHVQERWVDTPQMSICVSIAWTRAAVRLIA